MSLFIGKIICKQNKKIGVIIKENKKTFTYGLKKYVKKDEYKIKWDICNQNITKKFCNDEKFIYKLSKGNLPLRVRKSIYEMTKECFPETYGNFSEKDFINLSSFFDKNYINFWLEDLNKNVITFFRFDISDDTIWNICTNKEFRRQNCFNTLFKYFLSKIKQKNIYLWVFQTNTLAINAYKKLGFNIIDKDEDSYKMMLTL